MKVFYVLESLDVGSYVGSLSLSLYVCACVRFFFFPPISPQRHGFCIHKWIFSEIKCDNMIDKYVYVYKVVSCKCCMIAIAEKVKAAFRLTRYAVNYYRA
jgi:hypothetical protein